MTDFLFEKNRHILFDGNVVVFATGTAKKLNYQVRIKLPNTPGYAVRKSLKTSIEHEAIHLATEMYLDVRSRHSQGFSVLPITWSKLVEEFLSTRTNETFVKMFSDRNRLYWEPFFSKYDTVERIDTDDIKKYWVFRQAYWKNRPRKGRHTSDGVRASYVAETPSYATLYKENSHLRAIIKYGFQRGMISKLPVMEHPYKDDKTKNKSHLNNRKRRASFDDYDYKVLTRNLGDLCKDFRKHRPLQKRTYEALRLAVLLISNGLIRPMEMYRLRWGQIKLENINGDDWTVCRLSDEQAKNNNPRPVAFQNGDNVFMYVQRFRKHALWTEDSDLIFARDSARTKRRNLEWIFNKLTAKWKISHDEHGRKRTLYSLRHYGIEQLLIEGVAPLVVAKLAGHRVSTLEQFYDETGVLLYLKELRGDRKIYPKWDDWFEKEEAKAALKLVK